MNVYLSEFAVTVNFDRGNSYDENIEEFVSFCIENDFEVSRSNEFTNYDDIDSNIRKSDVLVAYIDDYWLSSTWKLHEVFYAIGDYESMGKEKLKAGNTKVILFYVDDVEAPILENIKSVVKVANNISELKNYVLSNKNA